MNQRRRWEIALLGICLLTLLTAILPAVLYSRREHRDGIRRLEVIAAKRALEQFKNAHNYYPLHFDAKPHAYIVEAEEQSQAGRWYVRAELENASRERHGFDEEYNVYFRYLSDQGRFFYDVCGGVSTCGVVPPDDAT